MNTYYNTNYPSVDYLRKKARKKIPGFAFDYLDGGCNEEINLDKNTSELRQVELLPYYLSGSQPVDLKTELFGHVYDAPFGIAPVGLQGLIWPNAPEILAKAAFEQNIPFILSTVSTSSIERVSELTEGRAWFQLYHPQEDDLRDKILQRASEHCPVLVILSDVPGFGYRSKEIKNGLSMPPRMTLHNILQIMGRPHWALRTLIHGTPGFATLKPYIPKGMNMHHLGLFMNKTFNGKLNVEKVAALRDKWKGKLVIKGIVTEEDTEKVIKLGLDGIIVSNHGGRQLDAAESSVRSLERVVKYKDKIKVMIDSGMRSGPDIARALASGAEFAFMGRSFMYGVAALGQDGGTHTINILKTQFRQVMMQVGCEKTSDLPNFIVK
ncbi:MAG: alpha-hydroxy-acid oxidizing enzyme [Pseudopedobacter saltans]|uniref:Alpha-hydroxy-acid oxidizing enzyme n=1 Tax=Pseudopedobacter saltans TaxID=151895 RepID=A0A2W5F5R4_9SPHI|nr:MAG: alpha-hydroxy-acid oxidizing enzyme [Pseudopedobacter saltans]